MKRTIIISSLFALVFIASSAFIKKSSTGIAGYTGSPGESTCASCHSGGSSAIKGVTITASPSFSNNQYMADSTYQINIVVGANNFSRFGFDCEILGSLNNDAGVIQNPGPGVQIQSNWNGRTNALHTAKKVGTNAATFSFEWVAPSSGRVNFYVCGNAVNNNNNTSGDLPLPHYQDFYPAPLPPQDTTIITGLNKVAQVTAVNVFPNPARQLTTVSYFLKQQKQIRMILTDLNGATKKQFADKLQPAGQHSEILNLEEIADGIYFLQILSENSLLSSKLLTIKK